MHAGYAMPYADDFVLQWFPAAPLQPVRAVALVAHGLNVKPVRMAPLAHCLTAHGIETLNITLHGHGANYVRRPGAQPDAARLESLRQVSYQLWRDELYAAYKIGALRAAQLGPVPVYLVAYSLGGLIGCDLFAGTPDVNFDKMVLFAPALQIQPLSYVLWPLLRAPRTIIRSFSPQGYRSNRGTSMAAYGALYTAAAHLGRAAGAKLNVPTLVFLDKQDELVSYGATARFLAERRLTNWRLYPVVKDSTAEQRYHHLLIDASSVGQATWDKIAAATIAHLQA
jgi:alpha-beta hydrolase superfamily lysophospholipase